jgi:hypothetical protein
MVDKYARRSGGIEAAIPEPDDAASDLGCFGWLRGARERAVSLELRKKDGRILAIGFSWIDHVEYDPDRGITLHTPDRTVRIIGSGLNTEVRPGVSLFGGLIRHRVSWVREAERVDGLVCSSQAPVHVGQLNWDG